MKNLLLLLVVLFSFNAFAYNVRCDLNKPLAIETNFGVETFQNAIFDFSNITRDGYSTNLYVSDRYSSVQAYFYRLWENRIDSNNREFSLSTDFNSIGGLSFLFPVQPSNAFTMRLRDNRNFRTYLASCRAW